MPVLLLVPFLLLLALIAVMPLTPPRLHRLWERAYPAVSIGLAAVVVVYYLTRVPDGAAPLAHGARDYLGFICLIGSLFVVAGGIHLRFKGEATPFENIMFLAVGAVVANVIGTTGASMILIRPWIRMNQIRIAPYHVVFFIFIVSNIGGALTPIGDPPLFIGYLRGIPFFWLLEHVTAQWLVTVLAVLAAFLAFDARSFRRLPVKLQLDAVAKGDTWRVEGAINGLFLLAVVAAVFIPDRFFLREILMVAAAVASWLTTPRATHEANRFTFSPLKEVAFLFFGIFLTMVPALAYLELHGPAFGLDHPIQYYFASGGLSAVLDNAPTYASFLTLAEATAGASDTAALLVLQPGYVVAISLGAVFFGAMTYIGNGPNFMVKAIAQDAGVHCPTFFGYIVKYSLPILFPILAVVGWLLL